MTVVPEAPTLNVPIRRPRHTIGDTSPPSAHAPIPVCYQSLVDLKNRKCNNADKCSSPIQDKHQYTMQSLSINQIRQTTSLHLLPFSDRCPYTTLLGLDANGEGGGTASVVSLCLTIRSDRLFLGFDSEALKALWMSVVEKESLRGSWVWLDGSGIVSVMFVCLGWLEVAVVEDCLRCVDIACFVPG